MASQTLSYYLRPRSHCSVFVSIRFCWWKRCPFTLLRFQMNTLWKRWAFKLLLQNGTVNPFFKTIPFVSSCQEGGNREFECHNACHCIQQPFNKGMWRVFECLRFWRLHWKRIVFKTQRFQICAFSLAFSQRGNVDARPKRINFPPFSFENIAVWTGPQCELVDVVSFPAVYGAVTGIIVNFNWI